MRDGERTGTGVVSHEPAAIAQSLPRSVAKASQGMLEDNDSKPRVCLFGNIKMTLGCSIGTAPLQTDCATQQPCESTGTVFKIVSKISRKSDGSKTADTRIMQPIAHQIEFSRPLLGVTNAALNVSAKHQVLFHHGISPIVIISPLCPSLRSH